jgi:Rieske Fe-S protein
MAEFKLKELSSLTLNNGDKVEAEVEGIEGGKVLLVKLDDKVHAMNANCTHYGAPLKMGVLTPDGRLTCPWHGGEKVAASPIRPGADEIQLVTMSRPAMWRTRQHRTI